MQAGYGVLEELHSHPLKVRNPPLMILHFRREPLIDIVQNL